MVIRNLLLFLTAVPACLAIFIFLTGWHSQLYAKSISPIPAHTRQIPGLNPFAATAPRRWHLLAEDLLNLSAD